MILITGASGFIGGALSDYLEKANFKIRRSARNKISQNYFMLNLENSSEIENSCKEVNVVIHLASLDYLQSEKNFSEAKKINFHATKKLYKEAVKNNVSKFIYFSTAHVYGENLKDCVSETTDLKPLSNYAKTHLMAEEYLYKNAHKSKTNVIILRVSNIIGSPNSSKLKTWKYVANDLCLQAHKDKKIILQTQGLQKRDFLYIDDFINSVFKCFKYSHLHGEIINIGYGEPKKLKNIVKYIRNLINGGNPEYGKIKIRKDEILETYPDIKKAKKLLKWKPKVKFKQGIKKTINFYKQFNLSI